MGFYTYYIYKDLAGHLGGIRVALCQVTQAYTCSPFGVFAGYPVSPSLLLQGRWTVATSVSSNNGVSSSTQMGKFQLETIIRAWKLPPVEPM